MVYRLQNDATHYIIFPNKVFKIDRTKAAEYQAATDYGLTLGIPAYQLDFAPTSCNGNGPINDGESYTHRITPGLQFTATGLPRGSGHSGASRLRRSCF
ncbi:MAG: hypothetical protein WDN27_06205 [Candidatus Saccharibacteria bacterium]